MLSNVKSNRADRSVRCPVCGRGRILDAAAHTDPRCLHLFGPEQAERAEWFSKCPKCGLQIGISICPANLII